MRYGTMFFGFLFLFSVQAKGNVFHVPSVYSSIQQAIDAAQNGDTVVVGPGLYMENIDFKGKAVIVKSACGPAATTIDGTRSGSVVVFQNGEGPDAVLVGFRITNGKTFGSGGGILVKNASPVIAGNRVIDNLAGMNGGGIGCTDFAAPLIEGNTIRENMATMGGGVYCRDSSPALLNNVITRNTALPSPSASFGGGLRLHSASPLMVNNTIAENVAKGNGFGGGLDCWDSSPVILNTIFWDNGASTGPEISITYSPSHPSLVTVSYCDVKGGQGSVYVQPGSTLAWGNGMIDADPRFAAALDGDWHLGALSPCLDAGDKIHSGLPPEDFEGDPRVANGAVDMGADEFHIHLYFTGNAAPGEPVEVKMVGRPCCPALLFVGMGVLSPPLRTPFGTWYLRFPATPIFQGSIPYKGVLGFHARIPPAYPVPSAIHLQALVRHQLTNPCLVLVQ